MRSDPIRPLIRIVSTFLQPFLQRYPELIREEWMRIASNKRSGETWMTLRKGSAIDGVIDRVAW